MKIANTGKFDNGQLSFPGISIQHLLRQRFRRSAALPGRRPSSAHVHFPPEKTYGAIPPKTSAKVCTRPDRVAQK